MRFIPLLALLPLACATLPRAPDWYAEAGCERRLSDGSHRFCAESFGRDVEEARGAALSAALGHAAGQLQSEVKGSVEFDQSCLSLDKDGVVSSTCTEQARQTVRSSTARLAIRGAALERFAAERDGSGLRAFVVVKVPSDEWARLSREALGKTLVAVDCAEACPAAILDALTAALSSCGVPGATGVVTQAGDAEALKRRARESGAARALNISLRASDRGRAEGLSVAEAGGRWELIDSTDGRTLAAKGLATKSVTQLGEQAARNAALGDAVRRLSSPSCGLSEAQGSLCCAGLTEAR